MMKIIPIFLSFFVVMITATGFLALSAYAQDEPVALWTFEDGTVTETTVLDVVGGHDGERDGTTWPVLGKVGDYGLWFGGAECWLECDDEGNCWWECEDEDADNVAVEHDANLDPGTGSFSVTLWAQPKQINHSRIIWKNDGTPAVQGYYLMQAGHQFAFGIGDWLGCEYNWYDPNECPPNKAEIVGGWISDEGGFQEWYFVAGVRNRDITPPAVILYVNGVKVARLNDPTSDVYWEDQLVFGWQPWVAQESFRGTLDHIAIYNRALSAEEILEQYCAIEPCNQVPIASCKDVIVPAGASCSADALVDDGSYDPDGDPITIVQDPPGPYGLGGTSVTLTVTDDKGLSDQCTATVTVEDQEAPVIESFTVTPDILWPPNHKMVLVTPTITASDNCDPDPTVLLTSITMNEGDETNTYDPNYDSTTGDGNTNDDIQIDESGNICLRAERSGTGDGRIYTITYTATDATGNSVNANATVAVPHDQSE
jgi:hypothetical protein